MLIDTQNKRIALPASLPAYKTYLQHNDLLLLLQRKKAPELGAVLMWNLNALDMTAIDHTLVAGPNSNGHEQYGPHRTSRALAIVHLAVFEAVNAVFNTFESYHGLQDKIIAELQKRYPRLTRDKLTPRTAVVDVAITESAHDTLTALYPKKQDFADYAERVSLQTFGNRTDPAQMDTAHRLGYYLGKAAAKAVLDERGYDEAATQSTKVSTFNDGSSAGEPTEPAPDYSQYPIGGYPADGRWHPDPVHASVLIALGGDWMKVRPFVLTGADIARLRPTPPDINSKLFVDAYKEVRRLGGDATADLQAPRGTTPTTRSPAQTIIGDFWAYDGTALLCAPPRLYNEIATSVALQEKPIVTVADMARYLALVNVSLADAGISAWEAKYHWRLGRPVTYIRTLPADGTPEGKANPAWTPLGAPISNGDANGRNFTPPFPSFPSGHAVFGGALFQTLRAYWSTKGGDEGFSFISDEYNGRNYGPGETTPRPLIVKRFASFGEAERENARSRIYLGIHWQFDADAGIHQGNEVGGIVFGNAFRPKTSAAR
ncbi:vanadium-dependent haloperoxidase [Methylocapsa palsarum]|nr:vanadium-dependent haloperoxidase [Methylocapsa palsarum]